MDNEQRFKQEYLCEPILKRRLKTKYTGSPFKCWSVSEMINDEWEIIKGLEFSCIADAKEWIAENE